MVGVAGKPLAHASRHVWATVLAGGDGMRLRPLVRAIVGDERPKQYVPLLESRTLLRQTLDRVGRLVPPERTVVVSQQRHERYLWADIAPSPGLTVLLQPENRDTAAGVLLPAHWVHRRAPRAIVAVFPSDHFVLEENALLAHVREVGAFVTRHSERLVLLGARPTAPEPEYGWVEPGHSLGWMLGGPISTVLRFREKPPLAAARAYLRDGWLWNTLVLVVSPSTLIEMGRRLVPDVHDRLVAIGGARDVDAAHDAMNAAYAARGGPWRCSAG